MKRWTKLAACKRCSNTLPVGKNVYCSAECSRLARNEQQKAMNVKVSVELMCGHCAKKFLRSTYRLNRSKGDFCGRSCASKFYKENGTYDAWTNSAKLNAKGDWVTCAGCGVKQVYRAPWEIEANVQKCCDRKCFGLFVSRTQSGENHPLWGVPPSAESKRRQQQTMIERHGVPCGFMLAKHVSPSKAQLTLHDKLTELDGTLLPPEQNIKTDVGYFRVDALFPNQKLVVEFQGDWWHANPRLYKPDDLVGVNYGTRAEDVWARDARRKLALEAVGYRVHVIWESDWNACQKSALESVKSELEKV